MRTTRRSRGFLLYQLRGWSFFGRCGLGVWLHCRHRRGGDRVEMRTRIAIGVRRKSHKSMCLGSIVEGWNGIVGQASHVAWGSRQTVPEGSSPVCTRRLESRFALVYFLSDRCYRAWNQGRSEIQRWKRHRDRVDVDSRSS